jgi:hypothetical protein
MREYLLYIEDGSWQLLLPVYCEALSQGLFLIDCRPFPLSLFSCVSYIYLVHSFGPAPTAISSGTW